MNVLVLNSGSSSLKFQLINTKDESVVVSGHVDGIGLDSCVVKINGEEEKKLIANHKEAVEELFKHIDTSIIEAIGHRVVHGGSKFNSATIADADVIADIDELSSLAPLHNPVNLLGIKACKELLPDVPEVAVFDTAFHQTMEAESYMYAIPYDLYEKHGIRKYGFHGTSHKYLMKEIERISGKDKVNMVTCHLGNGASMAAIKDSKVIDTTMGLTPLQGLIMGTRCGDIDPEVVAFLERKENMTSAEAITLLNKKSGLLGITGKSDMRDVHNLATDGDQKAKMLIDMYVHRLVHYIGGYTALVGKLDALVFTAGTGQGAYYVREKVCKRLEHLGFKIDSEANDKPWITENLEISLTDSPVKIYVIPTNEELMIARETADVVGNK